MNIEQKQVELDKIREKLRCTEYYEGCNDIKSLKLQSPKYLAYRVSEAYRWLKMLRHEIDQHKCVKCSSSKKLQLHHLTYVRLYKELLRDVVTLCRDCHQTGHEVKKLRLTTQSVGCNLASVVANYDQESKMNKSHINYIEIQGLISNLKPGVEVETFLKNKGKRGTKEGNEGVQHALGCLRAVGFVTCKRVTGIAASARWTSITNDQTRKLGDLTAKQQVELIQLIDREGAEDMATAINSPKFKAFISDFTTADDYDMLVKHSDFYRNNYIRVSKPKKAKDKSESKQKSFLSPTNIAMNLAEYAESKKQVELAKKEAAESKKKLDRLNADFNERLNSLEKEDLVKLLLRD
jgi:hypothetical protein